MCDVGEGEAYQKKQQEKESKKSTKNTTCKAITLCIYANYVCIKLYTCKNNLKEGRKKKRRARKRNEEELGRGMERRRKEGDGKNCSGNKNVRASR